MLRVRIEMCPRGDESDDKVREIGRMYIANVGGDIERGDYHVAVCRRGTTDVPREIIPLGHLEPDDASRFAEDHPKAARAGRVENYPRLAYNVWRLIARAVLAAFPEEVKTKNGGQPVLDEQVMRGLQLMAACSSGPLPNDDRIAIGRALEWIGQGLEP